MQNKKGFTLLELLIAATIIGILAMYATISYRNSEIETRMAAARGKLEFVAAEARQFQLEGGGTVRGTLHNPTTAGPFCGASPNDFCLKVGNNGWNDPFVAFELCGDGRNTWGTSCDNASVPSAIACLIGKDHARMPNRYRTSQGYRYCVGLTQKKEVFGSED